MQTDEETAIRALLDRLFGAWARGDGQDYAACFTEDCDYIIYNGLHLRGRAANRDLHAALFRNVLKGTRIGGRIETLELLSPQTAFVHTVSTVGRPAQQTYTLVKQTDGWRIRAFQNTPIKPFSIWLTRWMQKKGAASGSG